MTALAIAAQIIIALGIFNVWILRYHRPTPFRPEGAGGIEEEFRRYGLPDWVRVGVGGTKLVLAVLLLVGIVVTPLAVAAASLMGVLMLGAVAAHVRVGDPWVKSVPAALLFVLSTVVVVAYAG